MLVLQQVVHSSSVDIRPEWAVVEQIPFTSLSKLNYQVMMLSHSTDLGAELQSSCWLLCVLLLACFQQACRESVCAALPCPLPGASAPCGHLNCRMTGIARRGKLSARWHCRRRRQTP